MRKFFIVFVCAATLASCGGEAQENIAKQAKKAAGDVSKNIQDKAKDIQADVTKDITDAANQVVDKTKDMAADATKELKEDKILESITNEISSTSKNTSQASGSHTLTMKTNKFIIRIDKLKNNTYRYSSWRLSQKTSEKPNLVLENGTYHSEIGNQYYMFKNGAYTYTCFAKTQSEGNVPTASLVVSKGGDTLVDQAAEVIKH